MNSHEGGDVAKRLRCTHLSFDYARGKYPERVPEDHTISEGRHFVQGVPASPQGVPVAPLPQGVALRSGGEGRSLRSRGKRGKGLGNFSNFLNFRDTSELTYQLLSGTPAPSARPHG